MEKIYVADFETRAGEQAIKDGETWVWAWAICLLDNIEIVATGSTIEEFMEYVYKLGDCKIYFHNLKFDGNFVLSKLIKDGYKITTEKELKTKEYSCLISDMGTFYQIKFKMGRGHEVTIWNSLNKIQSSVAKIGKDFKTKYQKLDIDYVEDRPYGYVMTDEEREYVKNDVRVVAEALKFLYEKGMDRMTASSDAFHYFLDMSGGKKSFRNVFPVLEYDIHMFCKNAYRGGFCYCMRPGYYKGVCGNTYDVNSLYPSMMHSSSLNIYPYGEPRYFKGKYKEDEYYPLYICRIKADFELKEGFIPSIQIKGNRFKDNEYIIKSDGVVEMTLTSVDLKLFMDHYDIYVLEFIDGWKFKARLGMFDEFIDHLYEIKKTSKGALRQWAKIMLNSFYGRFGLSVIQTRKAPEMIEGAVKYKKTDEDEIIDPIYMPVACFVTAYARNFTIRAAQKNYDGFIYADTDSLHMIGEAVGIEIHESNMSCWDHESEWDEAVFIRQKTYMEKIGGEWVIKAAGMNEATKEYFKDSIAEGVVTAQDFKLGLKIDGFKLMPKAVKGGVLLVPSKFEIKETGKSSKKEEYVKIDSHISIMKI